MSRHVRHRECLACDGCHRTARSFKVRASCFCGSPFPSHYDFCSQHNYGRLQYLRTKESPLVQGPKNSVTFWIWLVLARCPPESNSVARPSLPIWPSCARSEFLELGHSIPTDSRKLNILFALVGATDSLLSCRACRWFKTSNSANNWLVYS